MINTALRIIAIAFVAGAGMAGTWEYFKGARDEEQERYALVVENVDGKPVALFEGTKAEHDEWRHRINPNEFVQREER